MSNEGLETNAVGQVNLRRNQQGKADNQRLEISLKGLQTNETYQLLALLRDDTNYTFVSEITAGTYGGAIMRYVKIGATQNPRAGLGRWEIPLPNVLDPVSDIRALAIADNSTQAVLVADMTAPDKLTYLVKRWLDNNGSETNAAAQLRLEATTNSVQFRVWGYGMEPGQNYFLAVNGSMVDSTVANTNGLLWFTNLPVSPSDILLVRELAIWNSATNTVLSTRLP